MKDAYAARFFLLTFIITWGAWGLLILLGADDLDPSSPLTLLFLLGGFGPSLAGLIMTAASDGRAGLRSLWRRTLQVQFGFRWYLIIFLVFPAVNALTLLITWATGGSVPDLALARSLAAVLLLHWASTIASSILPTNQSETTGLAIISVVILIAMLRRPARELEIPEQPSGYKPAFNQKGKVS